VTESRFTWGDEVRVLSRDGVSAYVVGTTALPDGGWRYLIEFMDGSSTEVDDADLGIA
jgi:hypothetical protein